MEQIVVTYRRTRRLSMRIGKNGEVRVSVPYGVPKTEVEKFIADHQGWIEKARARAAERGRKREAFFGQLPLKNRKDHADAVARLVAIVTPLIEQHSVQMGVKPTAVSYRATISKWGSCNIRTGALQFSLYLLLLPDWCIESVVVHELAHLLVPNHSPKFYAVLDRHFPRWRDARNEIRSYMK